MTFLADVLQYLRLFVTATQLTKWHSQLPSYFAQLELSFIGELVQLFLSTNKYAFLHLIDSFWLASCFHLPVKLYLFFIFSVQSLDDQNSRIYLTSGITYLTLLRIGSEPAAEDLLQLLFSTMCVGYSCTYIPIYLVLVCCMH